MTTVYLVIQQGVYRHDIRGVYTGKDRAIKAAERSAAEDRDDYHAYEVHETDLDQYVEDVRHTGLPEYFKKGHVYSPGSRLKPKA